MLNWYQVLMLSPHALRGGYVPFRPVVVSVVKDSYLFYISIFVLFFCFVYSLPI